MEDKDGLVASIREALEDQEDEDKNKDKAS